MALMSELCMPTSSLKLASHTVLPCPLHWLSPGSLVQNSPTIRLLGCNSRTTKWVGSLPFFSPHQRPELSSVQFSLAQSVSTPWTAAPQASLSIANSWILLKLMSIESVMPSNHLTLCHPLVLQPSIFPNIRVFSKESVLHMRWLKYWSFSFSISPSTPYSGLISFRMDWLDLLLSKVCSEYFLQHHSSKASILWCSVFFIVQL